MCIIRSIIRKQKGTLDIFQNKLHLKSTKVMFQNICILVAIYFVYWWRTVEYINRSFWPHYCQRFHTYIYLLLIKNTCIGNTMREHFKCRRLSYYTLLNFLFLFQRILSGLIYLVKVLSIKITLMIYKHFHS